VGSRTVYLSHTIYPRSAVDVARSAFVGLCDIETSAEGPDLRIRISPTQDAPPEAIDEFLSYLLSAAIESHLASSEQ
jgi:hypothetical protein